MARRRRRAGTRAPGGAGASPESGGAGAFPESIDDQHSPWYPDPAEAPEGTTVRPIQPHQAVKPYRCPGCDHEIRQGTAHLVVVPDEAPDDRRHWHTSCWRRHLRVARRNR